MSPASSIRLPARSDPIVRAVGVAWRRLTGGTTRGSDRARRTLLACSGGGDSSGLALALAAAVPRPEELFVAAHIVHDLRPPAESLADRDAARDLAEALGILFVEARVSVRGVKGNAEGRARALRYRALAGLALEHGCPFIASAHHAQDQLETILMGLIRGAGPRGMSGAASWRRLGREGPVLIRPALKVERAELQRLCRAAGWSWREDATNTDRSRLRAALRHGVLPELERLRPGAGRRAARSAALLRDAAGLVGDAARRVLAAASPMGGAGDGEPGFQWDRALLRRERSIVLGAALRAAAATLLRGRGRDRLGARAVEPVIRAIRSRQGGTRRFPWHGLTVEVHRDRVEVRGRPAPADTPRPAALHSAP